MRLLCFFLVLMPIAAETYQVSGVTVDHLTATPLNHVLVNLISTAKGAGSVSAITESDGRFSFTDVPAGKYRLTAQRRGEMQQGFHEDGVYTTAVVVGPRMALDNLVFPLRTSASLTGMIMDEQGEPVAGAQVLLFRQSVVAGEMQTSPSGGADTNASGQFHFGHLRPGTYFVAASGRPWYSTMSSVNSPNNPTEVAYPVTWYGSTTDGEAASPIVVAEGAALKVEISVHALPCVHVQVAGSAGASARNFRNVNLFTKGPGGVRVPLREITLNQRDTQELTGFPAGRYEISMYEMNKGEPRPVGAETLDVVDGMTLPVPSATPASISGQLTFAGGEKPPEAPEVHIHNPQHSDEAEVELDGTFSFPKVSAGSYTVTLNTPGLWIQSMTVRGGKRLGEKLEVPANGNVNLSIVAAVADRLGKVNGFAQRGDAGFPGAMILLLPHDLSETKLIRRDQSDSDGSFTLPGVVPGQYTVVAIADGMQLPYKSANLMKPYVSGGVEITVSAAPADPVKVPVQERLAN